MKKTVWLIIDDDARYVPTYAVASTKESAKDIFREALEAAVDEDQWDDEEYEALETLHYAGDTAQQLGHFINAIEMELDEGNFIS